MEEIFITNKIKKIKLKESPLKEINFKDGINVITGKCGTGKTRIVKEIIIKQKAMNRKEFIETLSYRQRQMLLFLGINGLNPGMCIIADDAFAVLDDKDKKKLLKEMSKSNNQYILTSVRNMGIKNANILEIQET